MTMNTQKIIEILDPQAGKIRETIGQHYTGPVLDVEQLFAARRNGHRITLQEASTTNEFPVILRDGIRSITFDSYARVPTTWQEWVMTMPSDKQAENWVEENDIGELPVVHEGTPFPEFKLDLDRTLEIRNQKRGGIISVTEEMIRFNRLNILKRHAEKMGRAAARPREGACYSVATTAGDYNRTTADHDNGGHDFQRDRTEYSHDRPAHNERPQDRQLPGRQPGYAAGHAAPGDGRQAVTALTVPDRAERCSDCADIRHGHDQPLPGRREPHHR